MTEFTPIASLAGGMLIGCAAVLLMAANGRIAGISGIVSALLPPAGDGDLMPRLAFVAGIVASPVVYRLATGDMVHQTVSPDLLLMCVRRLSQLRLQRLSHYIHRTVILILNCS